MSDPARQLSALDAAFLFAETAECPMHVGSLAIVRPDPERAATFYEDVKKLFADRVWLAPSLVQKLANTPYDLDRPSWVRDEAFDIERHVLRSAVPEPAGRAELQRVAARLHAKPLDRGRPLWEVYVFTDLADGEAAIYLKMHHALVDGGAGAALSAILYDTEPGAPAPQIPVPKPAGTSEKPADPRTTFEAALGELWRTPLRSAQELRNFTLPRTGRNDLNSVLLDAAIGAAEWNVRLGAIIPDAVQAFTDSSRLALRPDVANVLGSLSAPPTPLNVTITSERTFATLSLPLERARAVASAAGGKINDVVLALAAGMLRRYLGARDALPEKTLVAYVPISVRESGDARLRNQTFGMSVPLATDVTDPVERIRRIIGQSKIAKELANPFKGLVPQLMDAPSFGTPMLFQLWNVYAGRARLADTAAPASTLVVSNVMLSKRPFYIAGAKIEHVYPLSIVTHGQGVNLTVQGYGDSLDFGVIAAASIVPDAGELSRDLAESFDELERSFAA